MKKFDFVKNAKFFALIVAIVLVVGIVSFFVRGFNLDVDFTGGTTMQISLERYLSEKGESTISTALEKEIIATVETMEGIRVSSFQRANNGRECILKISGVEALATAERTSSEIREEIFGLVADNYALTTDDLLSSSDVGATISGELKTAAITATIVAIVLMLAYITIRFDLNSGLAAIICLAHDVFVMIVAYSLFGITMNSTMIAALLTILGYSINATIIIFDRIRENVRKMGQNADFGEVVNVSIHQTLFRSVNTTITTFLTITMLYLVGVTSIRQFALPLMVGILAGLFSSVCLAGNLWRLLGKVIKIKKKKV